MLRRGLVAKVWLGVLVLAILGVLWLQIPDSHIWEFCFSLLLACVIVGLFFWLCVWTFRSLVGGLEERGRGGVGWVLRGAVIVAWWLLQRPIDRLMEPPLSVRGLLDVAASVPAARAADGMSI